MREEVPSLNTPHWEPSIIEQGYPIWLNRRDLVDDDDIEYWSGWIIKTRKGVSHSLSIPDIWHSHGAHFARVIYDAYKAFAEKNNTVDLTIFNAMLVYLVSRSKDWPVATFQSPILINDFFKEFLRYHFLEAHKNGVNINSRIRAWNKFISNIEEAFLEPGIWATPFGEGLVRPAGREVTGAKTHIRITNDGKEVKEKLLTDVPLHVTDREAIEILFKDIKRDINFVVEWAESHAKCLWNRNCRRRELAEAGTPRETPAGMRTIDEIGIENVCATFERDGFNRDEYYLNSRFGVGSSRADLAKLLALPTSYSLYPFQLLLVAEHPEITSVFLRDFELYNKRGQLSGLLKTNSGYQLIGYKDRKTKKLAEQKIALSERAITLVNQVIEITKPLREFLKKSSNDNWRYLFLTSGVGFAPPKKAPLCCWNKSTFQSKTLKAQVLPSLGAVTGFVGDKLLKFAYRVSLTSLRASCGVQVYLETKSVEAMAKALGHSEYRSKLLGHYLPDPILSFFQSRWIRIFQKAFICEAMKDSAYLLETTKFESMDELNTFLLNHGIKDIPEHLENPENTKDEEPEKGSSEVYISIDTGILTALLSLESAVANSNKQEQISGIARYWSEVSRLVSKAIENGIDYALKEHLTEAKAHADATKMEGLIYEVSA
jgi:hypothetical protein